jgi:hypothetical protein
MFFYSVHHLADIRQASAALGIFGGALAGAESFFGNDFFRDDRTTVFQHILFDRFPGIAKTVTDHVVHIFNLSIFGHWFIAPAAV